MTFQIGDHVVELPDDGQWHHVIATFDGVDEIKIYMDGEQLPLDNEGE